MSQDVRHLETVRRILNAITDVERDATRAIIACEDAAVALSTGLACGLKTAQIARLAAEAMTAAVHAEDGVLFRPQCGALADAMQDVRRFETRAALAAFLGVEAGDLRVEPYARDERIGWLHTHIVTAPGRGVCGFTNGPLQ